MTKSSTKRFFMEKAIAQDMGLRPNEAVAVEFFVTELKKAHKKNEIVSLGWFVDTWNKKYSNRKINDSGGKKIIRYIRDNGLIRRLMADNYGYFIAQDNESWEKYLQMIQRRVNKISNTYKALKTQR